MACSTQRRAGVLLLASVCSAVALPVVDPDSDEPLLGMLAIVFGAATWRGMGGNSGRGVEGKAYVGAGMLGAMIIGLAVVAVNTLYGAGNAGG